MRVTSAEWLERVQAWRASGLGAEAFVAGKDFEAKALRWWASRLARAPRPPRQKSGHATESAFLPTPARASDRVTFARVTPWSEEGALSAAHPGAITVLVGRHRIAIGPGFDAKLLRDVVHALGEVTT